MCSYVPNFFCVSDRWWDVGLTIRPPSIMGCSSYGNDSHGSSDDMHKSTRVLIADDSEEDRVLFRHILKTFDAFEVIGTTVNGSDTVAYLKRQRPYENPRLYPEPDLVFLDYQLGKTSGVDVLRQVAGQNPARKIVLWSDCPESINEQSAYGFGATLVCAKPKLRADLIKILTRAFSSVPVVPLPVHAPRFPRVLRPH